MREFQRRVRLALEEHNLLPGDPNRVFNSFRPKTATRRATARQRDGRAQTEPETAQAHDPTTLKPHESNPFSGE